jgi:dTDP-4-dehydrorhamnose reductase
MNAARSRLMVTGASGLLGHAICRMAADAWTVFAVYRRHVPQLPDIAAVQSDLNDPRQHHDLLQRIRPHAVIHAAANADVNACQNDPGASEFINVRVPARLAGLCARAGIAFAFTSTDLVFDGRQAPYDEHARVSPICVYGEQKACAERAVLDHYPGALVCRMPLMFGAAPYAARHFSGHMLRAIRSGDALRLFVDEYRTPVDCDSAAHGILTLLGRARGIVHLGGRKRVSRFELGVALARHLGIAPAMIRPLRIDDVRMAAPRAADCSLVSDKAYALGYRPASLEVGLRRFVHRFDRIDT